MGDGTLPTCAVRETLEHERAWELRPGAQAGTDAFFLFCTICACEVGALAPAATRPPVNGSDRRMRRSLPHPHGERGRGASGGDAPDPGRPLCASCGRDVPRLPAPYPPQRLCAFCAKFSG